MQTTRQQAGQGKKLTSCISVTCGIQPTAGDGKTTNYNTSLLVLLTHQVLACTCTWEHSEKPSVSYNTCRARRLALWSHEKHIKRGNSNGKAMLNNNGSSSTQLPAAPWELRLLLTANRLWKSDYFISILTHKVLEGTALFLIFYISI